MNYSCHLSDTMDLFPWLSVLYAMQRSVQFIAILRRFLFYCDVRLGRRVLTFLKLHLQHVGVAHPERKSG